MLGEVAVLERAVAGLPEGWLSSTVGETADILDSKRVPLNSEERRLRPGPYPYWGANGIVDYIDDYIFDEPLVLMAEDGGYFDQAAVRPICHRLDGRAWVNNHAHIIRPTGADRDYFYYWFVHRDITPFIKGGTRSKLNQAELKRLPIWLPTLDEQRRIAEVLRSVDEAIAGEMKVVEQAEKVKKGLLQTLLTRGMGHSTFTVTPLGEIPGSWTLLKSVEFCPRITDGTHDTPARLDNGVSLLTSKSLKPWGLDFGDDYFISEDDADEIDRRSRVEEFDIIFGMIGTIGNATIVTEIPKRFVVKNVAIFKMGNNELRSRYLKFILSSPAMGEYIDAHMTGNAQKFVPLKLLRNLPVPTPPEDEMREIVRIIEAVEKSISSGGSQLKTLKALKCSIMSDLFSGRVRVPA